MEILWKSGIKPKENRYFTGGIRKDKGEEAANKVWVGESR